MHNVLFQVGLSNGLTLQEGQRQLAEVEGEISPWKKLLAYVEENNVQIVSLVLVGPHHHKFTLPSSGKNPNFKPFRDIKKPISYRVERAIALEADVNDNTDLRELNQEIKEWYTVAVAVYNDYELQLWVSEMDPRKSWTLVVEK